jgi:hypothetical protein
MKLGFVSMPLSGHMNPMTALARRLQSRGHEACFSAFRIANPSFGPPASGWYLSAKRSFPQARWPNSGVESRDAMASMWCVTAAGN